jgi:hypothetical protein
MLVKLGQDLDHSGYQMQKMTRECYVSMMNNTKVDYKDLFSKINTDQGQITNFV